MNQPKMQAPTSPKTPVAQKLPAKKNSRLVLPMDWD
jgi:hypothetical protein